MNQYFLLFSRFSTTYLEFSISDLVPPSCLFHTFTVADKYTISSTRNRLIPYVYERIMTKHICYLFAENSDRIFISTTGNTEYIFKQLILS